jgi:molybdate transport repressor ModE-like protein
MTDHWIGLEVRHLVALQAIADEGSFKGAARLLGYTPSAISQQIASLERIVGVQVIAREQGRRALGLTEAGRILILHMSAIEARLRAAKADLDALTRGVGGPLRVGAFESVETKLLPEVVRRFREEFPEVEIEIGETLLDLDLLRSLERGPLDLAFGVLPLPSGPFEATVVLNDPWVLVAQTGSNAARSAPRTVRELAELPLVLFRSQSAVFHVLDRFRGLGIEPNVVFRSDYNEVVQAYAGIGLGVALMPRLAVNVHDDRTTIIELGDLVPPRQIAIVRHSHRATSAAVDAFVSLAADVGSRLESDMRRFEWRQSATA